MKPWTVPMLMVQLGWMLLWCVQVVLLATRRHTIIVRQERVVLAAVEVVTFTMVLAAVIALEAFL